MFLPHTEICYVDVHLQKIEFLVMAIHLVFHLLKFAVSLEQAQLCLQCQLSI